MKEETLREFRVLYNDLFDSKRDLEIIPEVKNNPNYSRYKTLAPEFYSWMISNRRKHGLKV